MAQITTVIFDMYETLVQNPMDLWRTSCQEIIREQNLDTSANTFWNLWFEQEKGFRAQRVKPDAEFQTYYDAWRDAFGRTFATLGISGDADGAARRFIRDISRRDPYPETRHALESIQKRWRTAVLSNADDAYLRPNVGLLGIRFEQVLSSEEARVYKPLPGLFLEMLRRLGVSPGEAVYVGDRQFEDVQGAQRVGMKAVWINRSRDPADPQLPRPDFEIHNLLQLPEVLTRDAAARDGAI